jgi:hypothetical protein
MLDVLRDQQMQQFQENNIIQLKSIRQKQIFNRLNGLHYQGAPLLACLQHKTHQRCIYLKADPSPAASAEASATWIKNDDFPANLARFQLLKIILPSNRSSYEFKPETYHLGVQTLDFTVPDLAVEAYDRKHPRFICEAVNIPVTLTQNAVIFTGHLLVFSTHGLLVELEHGRNHSFAWLNTEISAMLTIMSGEDPVYTGQVRLEARGSGQYLLTPNLEATPRYMPKQYRARRQQFVPSPDLLFEHPITGKRLVLKIYELSSLGFSVEEERSQGCLLPGLMLRNARISFAGNFAMPCVAQVVYYQTPEEGGKYVRIGLAILNIDIEDHLRLISLVQQAQDPNAYVSNQIDPAALFDFFFETGFLYPHKYAEIADRREEVTRSYLALYENGAHLGRHFVYQHAGQILGHFSSLRVFRKTWLSQHHAALNSRRAGLRVVRAISEYINDSYQLNPTNLEFIIGYYRESNRFPKRYFGDYVGELKDPKKTSLDCMSYLSEARKFFGTAEKLPPGWALTTTAAPDLLEFYGYYQMISGGLLPEALDLVPEYFADQSLSETYQKSGMLRQRTLYTLSCLGAPIALLDVQSSDVGLNLSEITNSIAAYLIDPQVDYFEMLRFAVRELARQHDKTTVPLMVFPHTYLGDCDFEADKEYTMWTLNVPEGMESYMNWMNRCCR